MLVNPKGQVARLAPFCILASPPVSSVCTLIASGSKIFSARKPGECKMTLLTPSELDSRITCWVCDKPLKEEKWVGQTRDTSTVYTVSADELPFVHILCMAAWEKARSEGAVPPYPFAYGLLETSKDGADDECVVL